MNRKDIFFEGRIYKDAGVIDLDCFSTDKQVWEYLNDKFEFHEVLEPHTFINYQNVTGMYELEYQTRQANTTIWRKWKGTIGGFSTHFTKDHRRTVAVPLVKEEGRMNRKDIRMQHIEFIEKDTEKRGERITSEITFFGALYQLFVKKEGDKRAKKVNYSAAENVMNGYRKILPAPTPSPGAGEGQRKAQDGWRSKDEWVREYEIMRRVMNMSDAIFQLVQMVQSEYEKNMDY